jgi:signal transduction histidine kinase
MGHTRKLRGMSACRTDPDGVFAMAKQEYLDNGDNWLLDDPADSEASTPATQTPLPWKILIVDDEKDVHIATRLVIQDIHYKHRGLSLFYACNAQEGFDLIARHPDIALILLDVVMENDQAGLQLVHRIRHELNNHLVRIVLRTGQPGQAPERDVILNYDINDYKTKTELTVPKMFTTVVSSLRAYESLTALESIRLRQAELLALLTESRDAAEAANRAKSVFLANMSHELRTPMTAIMGMTDLALRRAADPKQVELLTKSMRASQHLLAIINDLLDLSSIEADRLTLGEQKLSVQHIIDKVLQLYAEQAKNKGLSLSAEHDAALPQGLYGDADRLKQIVMNFVENAIKFSDKGIVSVQTRLQDADNHSVLLRIEVSDQGIGIRPDQQEKLFKPFSQADDTPTRQYGGTGLGLVICKRLAQLMGGDAGVTSPPGQGSTFWATMRLRQARDFSAPPAEAPDAEIARRYQGARILVADDDAMNLEVLRIQLERAGLTIDTTEDAAQALRLAADTHYAAILLDMRMPHAQDVAIEIGKFPGNQHTPIIAMSTQAETPDAVSDTKAGIHHLLNKPFEADGLFETLLGALGRS